MGQGAIDIQYGGARGSRIIFTAANETQKQKALGVIGASTNNHNRMRVSFALNIWTYYELREALKGEGIAVTKDVMEWNSWWWEHAEHLKSYEREEEKEQETAERNTNAKSIYECYTPTYGSLHPYQQIALRFAEITHRFMLCDDRGLGKSLEALSIAEFLLCFASGKSTDKGKTLIVCPNYLRWNWAREIAKWLPERRVALFEGERRKREQLAKDILEGAENPDYIIVNYEMMREEERAGGYPTLWRNLQPKMVICDEAHRLKAPKSQWVLGVKHVAWNADFLQLLTGSPISKDPSDIWQLLNLIDRSAWSSKWHFIEKFCDTRETMWGTEIIGAKRSALDTFHDVLRTYMLQRKKEDVAPWLPKKLHKEIYVPLEGKQLSFYKKLEKQMLLELEDGTLDIVATLIERHIRLQQAVANPALLGGANESAIEKSCCELAKDILEDADKLFVGTWFVGAAKMLAERMGDICKTYLITGETPSTERDAIIEEFKASREKCALIGTIKSTGEGINLDECDHVIFCDQSWNPADNEQFEDRIHRITSTRPKHVYRIIAKGTISDAKNQVLARKNRTISESMAMREAIELVKKGQW